MTASERRIERMNRPPSWRSALNRAGIAAGVFLAVLLILLKQPVGDSLALAGFMLLVYVPIGYAIDSFLYRLRQKRKAGETER
jgi:Na+/proline symporter